MPEIVPILQDCAPEGNGEYYVDAKVHMLMPKQFPCIPDWHGDAIPRDPDGKLRPDLANPGYEMYLWLSGPPVTEFKDGRKIGIQQWNRFRQLDIHRGTMSKEHVWRLFIRLMPEELVVRPRTGDAVLRRHTQVYLDSTNYKW